MDDRAWIWFVAFLLGIMLGTGCFMIGWEVGNTVRKRRKVRKEIDHDLQELFK